MATPLENALAGLFRSYAQHLLWPRPSTRPIGEFHSEDPATVPPFSARLRGPSLEISFPHSGYSFARRGSASLLLASDFWGAAQSTVPLVTTLAPQARAYTIVEGVPRSITPALAHAAGRAATDALLSFANMLAEEAPEEAILLLRRRLNIDQNYGPERPRAPFALAKHLHAPLIERAFVTEEADWTRTTTPLAALKKLLARFADTETERERLAAAVRLEMLVSQLHESNHLAFLTLAAPLLDALLAAGDGAVFETALGICQSLGTKLVQRRAYAEAEPLLGIAISQHVAYRELLFLRAECRLYLDEQRCPDCVGSVDKISDRAEDDFRAATAEDLHPLSPFPLRNRAIVSGQPEAIKRSIWERVAAAFRERAEGRDPCADRKLSKKDLLSEAARTDLRRRAEQHTSEASRFAQKTKG